MKRVHVIRKAAIYLRCSTEEQGESGLGLEAQEAKCRELCERKHWEVVGIHADPDISGRKPVEKRPGLTAALSTVEGQPGVILVANDLSRLARNVMMALSILDESFGRGVPFASASQADLDTSSPIGRAVLTVVAAFAQLEAEEGGKRTRAALQAAKARGVKLGSPTMIESLRPTGRLNRRGRMTYERYVDPGKLRLVQQVREHYRASDFSLAKFAEWLNQSGIASPTGKKWHERTVRVAVEMELPG